MLENIKLVITHICITVPLAMCSVSCSEKKPPAMTPAPSPALPASESKVSASTPPSTTLPPTTSLPQTPTPRERLERRVEKKLLRASRPSEVPIALGGLVEIQSIEVGDGGQVTILFVDDEQPFQTNVDYKTNQKRAIDHHNKWSRVTTPNREFQR